MVKRMNKRMNKRINKTIDKKKTMKGGFDFSSTPSSLHLSDLEVSNPDQVIEEHLTTSESFPSSSTPISLITQDNNIISSDSNTFSIDSGKTDKEFSTEVILGGKLKKRSIIKRSIKKRYKTKTKKVKKSKKGKKNKTKKYIGGYNIRETTSLDTNIDKKEKKEYNIFETLGFKK
jgi:hypothetical protein